MSDALEMPGEIRDSRIAGVRKGEKARGVQSQAAGSTTVPLTVSRDQMPGLTVLQASAQPKAKMALSIFPTSFIP